LQAIAIIREKSLKHGVGAQLASAGSYQN